MTLRVLQGLPPIVSLCQAPGGLQTTDISTVPSLNVPLPAFEELLGLQRTSGSSSGIDRRALPQTQNQQPLEASAPRNDTGVVSSAYLSAFYNMGAHGCTHHNPQIQPAQAMDPISWEQVPYQHYVETQQLNGQYSDVLPRDLRCELQPAESPHSGLNPGKCSPPEPIKKPSCLKPTLICITLAENDRIALAALSGTLHFVFAGSWMQVNSSPLDL